MNERPEGEKEKNSVSTIKSQFRIKFHAVEFKEIFQWGANEISKMRKSEPLNPKTKTIKKNVYRLQQN